MLKIDPFSVWSCRFLTTREASRAIVRDDSREQAALIGPAKITCEGRLSYLALCKAA